MADAFYLVIRVAIACRTADPVASMCDLGIRLPAVPTTAALLREISRAADEAAFASGRRTDFTEMGQGCLLEALAGWLRHRDAQGSLFGSPGERIWSDLRGLATQEGFADLAHRVFGVLASRILGFYLS